MSQEQLLSSVVCKHRANVEPDRAVRVDVSDQIILYVSF
jgi:hypothetical protein